MGVLYDSKPDGYPTGLTFIGESGSFCPPVGSYRVFPSSILELPRDRKATKFRFQFNEKGWYGLKVFNHDDCLANLEGRSSAFFVEKDLILAENEEIFAMRMGMEGNFV